MVFFSFPSRLFTPRCGSSDGCAALSLCCSQHSDHAYIASKQIVLAHISRLICIYALIYAVHTWFSPLYMLLCHRFPCFAVSSSSRSFHTSILGNNTLTSVPLAPRARRGLYPRDRDCLISKHRAATRVSKNEITE